MTQFDRTLERQLSRFDLSADDPPDRDKWAKFLAHINSHYAHLSQDRDMLARSLDLATEEMSQAQQSIQEERNKLRETIGAVHEAIEDFARACRYTRNTGGEDRSELSEARRSFNMAVASLMSKSIGTGNDDGQALLHSLRTSFTDLFEEVISMVSPDTAMTPEAIELHRALICEQSQSGFNAMEVSARCEQLHAVGGDMWNCKELDSGDVFFCVGDATGHGTAAGMMSLSLAVTLEFWLTAPGNTDLAKLAASLDELVGKLGKGRILATWCACLVSADRRSVSVVNAGHSFPIIRRGKRAKSIIAKGDPLGTGVASPLSVGRLTLQKNDQLLVYTDGITETQNRRGQEFGDRRLRQSLERMSATDPADVIDAVWAEVDEFGRDVELQDDRTLFVAHIN